LNRRRTDRLIPLPNQLEWSRSLDRQTQIPACCLHRSNAFIKQVFHPLFWLLQRPPQRSAKMQRPETCAAKPVCGLLVLSTNPTNWTLSRTPISGTLHHAGPIAEDSRDAKAIAPSSPVLIMEICD
jgi:hypothetical protein